MARSSSQGFCIVIWKPGLMNQDQHWTCGHVSVLVVHEAKNGLRHQSHQWERDICHLTMSCPRVFGNEVLGSGDPGVCPLV